MTSKRQTDWVGSVPFILMHIAAVGVLWVHFSWALLVLCIGMYALRMFGLTAGYHRYFSHRTYKMGRVAQFMMAVLGTLSVQKGVLWWAANHRHHHRFSDQPEDIHSPVQGSFLWSHLGWFLCRENTETRWELIKDLSKYRELRWLNRFYLVPVIAMAALFYLAGGLSAFMWGFVLSTVILWHGTFVINSLSHVYGSRRYVTTDDSRNNAFFAIITLGEGWHNNHHAYMSSTRQGFFWWEIDLTYYVLKLLSTMRIVSDMRKPPLELLEERRIHRVVGGARLPAEAS